MKILVIPSWYPNDKDPLWGNYFIKQAEALNEGFVSGITFVTVIAIGVILFKKSSYEKMRRITDSIAVFTLMTQIITLIVLASTVNLFDRKIQTISTTDNEMRYSSGENFIILILDRFDQREFDKLLGNKNSDYVTNTFENFTYYPDTLSLYQMTDYSLPQIVADSRYLCDEPFHDYIQTAFSDSYLIDKLNDLGYETNIYTTITLPDDPPEVDNWKRATFSPTSSSTLLSFIYRLIAFRYMPQQLKDLFWFYPDDLNNIKEARLSDQSGRTSKKAAIPYEWFNSSFNDIITSEQIKIADTPGSFHLYHLKGMHPMYKCDRQFNPTDYTVSKEETELSLMDMLNNYFDALKEVGIYDNSSIIVMADHGEMISEENQLGHLPIFLYKAKKEKHPLITDYTPHSYSELNTLYATILEDETYSFFSGSEYDSEIRFIYEIIKADGSTYAENNVAGFKKIYVTGDSSDYGSYEYRGEEYLIK